MNRKSPHLLALTTISRVYRVFTLRGIEIASARLITARLNAARAAAGTTRGVSR